MSGPGYTETEGISYLEKKENRTWDIGDGLHIAILVILQHKVNESR